MCRWQQLEHTLWEDVGLWLVGIDLFEDVLVKEPNAVDVAMMLDQPIYHLLLRRPARFCLLYTSDAADE